MKISKILDFLMYLEIICIIITPIIGNMVYYVVTASCIAIMILETIKNKKILINYFEIGYILFIIYAIFSLLYSVYLPSTNYIIKEMSINFLICYSIVKHIKRKNNKNEYLKILDVFTFGTCLLSIYLFVFELPYMSLAARLGQVLFEEYGTYIVYSYYLIISGCYLIWRILMNKNDKNKKNILLFLELIIILIASLLSGTRKCVLCLAIFTFLIFLYKNRNNLIKVFTSILLGVIFLMSGYRVLITNDILYTIIGKRMESMVNNIVNENIQVDASMQERELLRNLAIQAFKEKFFLGYGMNNFAYYSQIHGGPFLYAHSNYLELLSSGGIVATGIYYTSYIALLILSIKGLNKRDKFCVFIFSFLLMNLISDYSTVSYYRIQYLLVLILFANYLTSKDGKNEERKNINNE